MMTDSEFEDRVSAVNWMLGYAAEMLGSPGELQEFLRNRRVVEIGSGFGAGAIASIRSGASQYVGIEPEPFGSQVIKLDGSDPGFRACYERAVKGVDRSRILFLEGFADDWPGTGFDVCLIADVLEHVDQPKHIAESASRLLKRGGIVIASTCPLYFSAYGHHLFDVLAGQPWGHLYEGFSRASIIHNTSTYLLSEFDSLNGVTHGELLDAFSSAGFRISHERTLPQEGVDFLQVQHRIKLEYLSQHSEEVFNQSVSQFIALKN